MWPVTHIVLSQVNFWIYLKEFGSTVGIKPLGLVRAFNLIGQRTSFTKQLEAE